MKKYQRTLLCSAGTAALALFVQPAFAQDSDVETIEDSATAAEETTDTVTVTGSRIRRDTFSSPVSLDVLTVEDARIEGISDISGLLQTTTAASGSLQITNAVSSSFVANGGVGAETVGLRGLGASRTLDLINGRRAGPSGTRGSVSSFDLGSIPLVGVERVEILKDGASSIYGSDAIAGVINYITDKSDDKSIDAYISAPFETGGEVYRISGTYGDTFERGRFRVTADYYKAEELARGDRDFLDCNENYSFTDASFSTRADVIDPRTGQPQCGGTIWGHVWVYDYGSDNIAQNPRNLLFQYSYPGENLGNYLPEIPVSQNGGLIAPPGWYQVEYNGSAYETDHTIGTLYEGLVPGIAQNAVTNLYAPMEARDSVTPMVERISLMGDAEFEVMDGVTAYAEGLFNRRTNYVNGHDQYWTYQYGADIFGTPNPAPLDPNWGGDLSWFSPTPIVEHGDEKVTVDYMRFVGGLRGGVSENLPVVGGWDWDVYAQYSDSHGEYANQLVRADAIFPYRFSTSSCEGTTTPGASGTVNGEELTIEGRPCTDIRWFDPYFLAGELTDAERLMLLDTDVGYTDFDQFTMEGFLSGEILALPAGDLGAAFGVFYQRDEIYDRPSDTTLLGNEFFGSSAGITTGVQKTQAIYTELNIPIVKDVPLADYLAVAVSGRYSEITSEHQDGRSITVDGDNYRATLDWRVNDTLRFRASQGTSFRAPGLYEQFLADESSSLRQSVDPCIGWATALEAGDIDQQTADNCAADGPDGIPGDYAGAPISITVLQGGGFGVLTPETSENFTIGAVFTPDFAFADLSFAVDYFDITVKDEIDTLSASQIVLGCYESQNFETEPLCDLLDRGFDLDPPDPTVPNRIVEVRATFININEQVNRGIDYTFQAKKEFEFGDLSIFAQASNQLEDEILLLAEDSVEYLNGGIGEPEWTGFANITFEPSDKLIVRWGMDYIGEMDSLRDIYDEIEDYSGESDIVDGVYTVIQEGETVFWKTTLEPTIYHSLSASYEMDSWVFRAGVNNLFDEAPPTASYSADAGNTNLLASQHDLLGRRVFFNFTRTFN